jgi:hypothetical protein
MTMFDKRIVWFWVFALAVGFSMPQARAQTVPSSLTCGSNQTLIYLDPPGTWECINDSTGSSSGGSSGGGDSASTAPSSGKTSIGGVVSDFAKWLLDALLYVPKWIWQELLKALAAVITAIPVPTWFQTFSTGMAGFTSQAVWWLDLIQFKVGLTMIAAALLARFLLRRVPLIG